MKKITTLIILAITIIACSSENKKETPQLNLEKYPLELVKVFEAHGGLDKWKEAKMLSFRKGKEQYTIDLENRKTLIKAPKYTLGYNGENVWLKEKDSAAFKGNPNFYHNLFFYFYAMPFVLADDGITYSETESLVVDGETYPGIKISYKQGVGASSKDNYYLYYNAKTFKMEWLAYTSTYFDQKEKEKSQASIIKYEDWQAVGGGTKLPKAIVWYAKDSVGNVIAPKDAKPVTFTKVSLNTNAMDSKMFEK